MRALLLVTLSAASLFAQEETISGTWVAKSKTPMGEMEIAYEFKQDANGHLTGTQKMPFGDWPIVDGHVNGSEFTFTVEMEFFGDLRRRETTGKIVGDALEIMPVMPGPPS